MNYIDNKQIYNQHWQLWTEMKLYGPASRWLRQLIGEILGEIPSAQINSILDVGCGEGSTTQFIANKLPNALVRGIDFSETGIELATSHWKLNNLEFKCELDSASLKNHWDIICAFEVMEHIEDWQVVLTQMANSAKKYLILSFPTGRMRNFEVQMGHFRNFKKGEVENFLGNHSFFAKKIFYAGFPFYSPLYRELCNLTNADSNQFVQGKYGISQKMVSSFFYFFFRYMSTKNKYGDQFCGLFERIE
jgi:SAM-dependent methyltransferase